LADDCRQSEAGAAQGFEKLSSRHTASSEFFPKPVRRASRLKMARTN
jgi:hypothetical protein